MDVALLVVFYTLTCLGVTVGYHRYLTHGSFKAHRAMRIALAIAGGFAVQGPVLHWVADHRRVYDVRWPTPARLARISVAR